MKILIGNTGLVGKTLSSQMDFDLYFNSKNIKDFDKIVEDDYDIYLSCLPAEKWKINQSPQSKIADLKNCLDIADILSSKKYNNIVLLSTIDVYLNSKSGCDEDKDIAISNIGYGQNRLIFERLIENEIKFNSFKIYRLPALFGSGIKKNVLFDLMNNNNLDKINVNSYYQWYNLKNLSSDIELRLNSNSKIFNLFTEPIHTKKIIDLYFNGKQIGYQSAEPVIYDYKTKHSDFGYIDSAENILRQIGEFLNANRN